jgi:peroxiredoxin
VNLNEALQQKKHESFVKYSEDKLAIYENGIKALAESSIIKNAIKENDIAPNFMLNNAHGNAVNLYSLLEHGSVVLTWYRGGWCPYCNISLQYLQKILPQIKELNTTLIAISPELPDRSLHTKEKNELDFEVLSDVDNEVASLYNILFTLPKEVAEVYKQSFSLLDYNGNDNNQLPLAATYVINKNKKIVYAFLNADYRERADTEAILEALSKI